MLNGRREAETYIVYKTMCTKYWLEITGSKRTVPDMMTNEQATVLWHWPGSRLLKQCWINSQRCTCSIQSDNIYGSRSIEVHLNIDPTDSPLRFITVWIPVAVDSSRDMKMHACNLASMLSVETRATFSWKASGGATIPDTLCLPTTKGSLIATRTTLTSDSWKESKSKFWSQCNVKNIKWGSVNCSLFNQPV